VKNLKEKLSVTVLIPTYKRAHLLKHVLEALDNQTYKDFDVVVIVKPSGDKTVEITQKFAKLLKIKIVIQEKGYFTDAINLGLQNTSGDITAFLDDDAIPFPDWIKTLVETYALPNVGGVAGNVIPAFLNEKDKVQFSGKASEIVFDLDQKPFLNTIGQKTWSRPLKGLQNYLVYISKAGNVEINFGLRNSANQTITKSLLGMGANMSVLTEATKGFKLPNSWIMGWGNEQFLGWHIWKKGYNLLYNPNAKVSHLIHGQSLARYVKVSRKLQLKEAEIHLVFYRLYGLEKDLSVMNRICYIILRTFTLLKHAQTFREAYLLLKGVLIGNIIGCKWVISNKLGLRFDPLFELQSILGKSQ
jgi:glycosyltransferase involved in cell wall biosynthesis